jgi:hypothetical protein
MLPPATQQKKTRKYSREDWNAQRSEITRLYESGTLESVMNFMRERYGLDATWEPPFFRHISTTDFI